MLFVMSWVDQQEDWNMQRFIEGKEVLTTKEVAKRFSVTEKTVRDWANMGLIERIKYDKKAYFTLESIKLWEGERNK